jgi:hypothetical protein
LETGIELMFSFPFPVAGAGDAAGAGLGLGEVLLADEVREVVDDERPSRSFSDIEMVTVWTGSSALKARSCLKSS